MLKLITIIKPAPYVIILLIVCRDVINMRLSSRVLFYQGLYLYVVLEFSFFFSHFIWILDSYVFSYIHLLIILWAFPVISVLVRESLHSVMVKVLDCDLKVSEYKLKSHFYIHFQTTTFGKGMNSHIVVHGLVDANSHPFSKRMAVGIN